MLENTRLAAAEAELRASAALVEERLARALEDAPDEPAPRLRAAMRHSALGGGKRLRAHLARSAYMAAGGEGEAAPVAIGAALELLHAYSLIHDDLPAMDDAALRRGRATCHRAFDEATAILAGDALQALAFELLADPRSAIAAPARAPLCLELARAAGGRGMCAGQALDLEGEAKKLDAQATARMEALKTGALIAASARMGAIAAAADAALLEALTTYARALGYAFQIQDDILDATSDAASLGKDAGADAAAGKSSAVEIFGLDGARAALTKEGEKASAALDHCDERADPLRNLVAFVIHRRR